MIPNLVLLAATLVPNGNFESDFVKSGWLMPDACYRVTPGEGRKGSTALVWESKDPEVYKVAKYMFPVEPGNIYRVSGWVKTDSLSKGGKALVEVSWHDKDRRFIWFRAAAPVENNLVGDEGWQFVSALTKPLPVNAAWMSLACYAHKGTTGRVRFDDVEVVNVGSKPIDALASSAYRDTASSGRVRFAASLNLNEVKHPIPTLKATLRVRDRNGAVSLLDPDEFTATRVVFERDVSKLAFGTQDVVLSIVDRRGGGEIASAKLPFTRTREASKARVTLDGRGRLIVEGKPFFPVGMWLWGMKDEDYDRYLSSPFNCGIRYGKTTSEELDRFGAKGVKLIVDMRKSSDLQKDVTALAGNPALLAWFVADEIEADDIERARAMNHTLHELDPDHPVYGVHNKSFEMCNLLGCYDIGGIDAYPIGAAAPFNVIGTVYDRCLGGLKGALEVMPMWHVPQTFDWTYYGRDKDPRFIDVRMPTGPEMANMSWQTVAAGGNGVLMYAYFELPRTLKGEDYDRTWKEICSTAAELRKMESVVLSDEDGAIRLDGLDKSLVARCWRHHGRDWVLLVNRTREAVSAKVKLPNACAKLRTAVGGGVALDGAETLNVDFPALGYAFFGMERK